MKTSLICFSDAGAHLAIRIGEYLKLLPSDIHSIEKFAVKYGFTSHKSVCADMGELFAKNEALIFIGACGIAVRDIAPHIKNKTLDPAVLVVDDQGKFVIPILSGHIGGANALAIQLAAELGATPIITTATDGVGKFSCDSWAVTHNCAISSLKTAKEISAAILTENIPISSEYALPYILPNGLVAGKSGERGLFVGIHTDSPYQTTLRLIPRIVTLGVGCRRGASTESILTAIKTVLETYRIDIHAVCRIASVDLKKDEAGLLECAKLLKVPTEFYTASELNTLDGAFSESEFVKQTVGVGNVCERAAVFGGRSLMIPKTVLNGVTVAAATEEWRVTF